MSISIKKLEEELGVPLFDRSCKKLKLNAAGKTLLKRVNVILNEIDAINTDFFNMGHPHNENVITMYSPSMTSLRHFSHLFYHEKLNFEISSKLVKFEELEAKLKNKECDICFTEKIVESPDIMYMPIMMLRVYISIPESNPLSKKKFIKWADLNGQIFMKFEGTVNEPLVTNMNKVIREQNVKLNYVEIQYDDFLYTSTAASSDYLCFTNNITEKYTPRGNLPGRTLVKVVDEGSVCPLYISYLKEHNLKIDLIRSFIHNNYKKIMI